MVKLNDIEKKLQNYQEGVEYNVRYENNGEKRAYTIYPGKALEFIRQVVANTPPPPFLSRPKIQSNSTVEYKIEENNGVITGQSFTVKTPSSGSDFSGHNANVGNSNLWNSSIFGRQFNNQNDNHRALEFRQPSNQDFSVTQTQPQFHNQDVGICHCKSAIKRPLPNDWNRCLQCGGMFNDAGSEESDRRQKAQFERARKEQEEISRTGQENERRTEEIFNRLRSGGYSSSYQQNYYSEPQSSRFVEINEGDSSAMETNETETQFFQQQQQQQQQQQHVLKEKRLTEIINTSRESNKLPKTVLIAGSSIVLVSGISLLYFLKKQNFFP
jgi:hypothetical protein